MLNLTFLYMIIQIIVTLLVTLVATMVFVKNNKKDIANLRFLKTNFKEVQRDKILTYVFVGNKKYKLKKVNNKFDF